MADDFDDLYGSKYRAAADTQGQTKLAKIVKVDIADFKEKDGTIKRKYVVHFDDGGKPMVLNKTNANRLAAAYGKDRRLWAGQTVELYSETTSLGEGLQLRTLPKASPPARAAKPDDDDMSESIPF